MEVTGLVLSLGERMTKRAILSLKRQTVPCQDIVVVKNVTPFHKAMNKGIQKVKTPFFIQCDADMILDPDCIETMLKFVKKKTGVVAAFLEDPLLGKIQAVKMFRKECFEKMRFSNHVSPDTDLIYRLRKEGWDLVFAHRKKARFSHGLDILGKHEPDYTPLYTFEKFKLEGSRMYHRGIYSEYTNALETLHRSPHPMAPIAIAGLCKGILYPRKRDGLTKYHAKADFKTFKRYMVSDRRKHDDFIAIVSEKAQKKYGRKR